MTSLRGTYEEASNIRVLTANFTGIIAELIVQEIQRQSDIDLLGTVSTWNEANSLMGEATIFVVGFEDEVFSSSTCLDLLNDYPQLKILILRANSDEGIMYWQVLHSQQMQVISAQTLIESIRHIRSSTYADIREHSGVSERN
jgi:hypothetical protein